QRRDVQTRAEAQFGDSETAPPAPGLGQSAPRQEDCAALGQAVLARKVDVVEPSGTRRAVLGPQQSGRTVVGHGSGRARRRKKGRPSGRPRSAGLAARARYWPSTGVAGAVSAVSAVSATWAAVEASAASAAALASAAVCSTVWSTAAWSVTPEASAASVAGSAALSSALLLQAAKARAAAEAAIRAVMRMGISFVRTDDSVPGSGIPTGAPRPQVNLPQDRAARLPRNEKGPPARATLSETNPKARLLRYY